MHVTNVLTECIMRMDFDHIYAAFRLTQDLVTLSMLAFNHAAYKESKQVHGTSCFYKCTKTKTCKHTATMTKVS